jgi:hypothetical protein
MADSQALVSFPGINQIFSAHYALAHGITPGVVSIEIAPQTMFPKDRGEVVWTVDGTEVLRLTDCKLDSASYEADDQGQILRLNILDRRWKWAFPVISLRANIRDDAFNIIEGTELAPTDIVKACMKQLGEDDYKFDAFLNESRPSINWDYTNAAQALAELCDTLGCRVVLSSDNKVHICTNGAGEKLPQTPDVLSYSEMPDPLERPDLIIIVGGVTRWQYDFLLRPVAKELDGTISYLYDVSYRPDSKDFDGGWANSDPPYFSNVDALNQGLQIFPPDQPERAVSLAKACAQESVFKWYMIDWLRSKWSGDILDFDIHDMEDANEADAQIRRILPLDTTLIDQRADPVASGVLDRTHSTLVYSNKPAMVYGIYFKSERISNAFKGNSGEALESSAENLRYGTGHPLNFIKDESDPNAKLMIVNTPFTIDRENGMVKFSDFVYRKIVTKNGAAADIIAPAILVLRTCVSVKDNDTHQWTRENWQFPLNPPPGQKNAGQLPKNPIKRYIMRDDLVLQKKAVFSNGFPNAFLFTDNWQQLNEEAKRQMAAIQAEYDNVVTPQTATYVGLKQISLDGAIGLVIWEVNAGGSTTTAHRNNDVHPFLMSYRERRHIERTTQVQALTPILGKLLTQLAVKP